MDQNNGGILGKINTPTTSVASGVWSLDSQFEAQSSSIWPLAFPQTTIVNSCRFETDTYMTKTASSGNTKTLTFSFWVKRSFLGAVPSGSNQFPIGTYQNANNRISLAFLSDNTFILYGEVGGSAKLYLATNRVFRDTSAWMHFVCAIDTTQSTSSDRAKIYINGVEETSFSTATYPNQDQELIVNTNIYVGTYDTTNNYYHGYLAEVIYVDGTALDQTSFGAINPATNIWEPIAYTGAYGTNGFRLDFADSSNLGNDANGGTDLTEYNLVSTDQSTDTCSNNFAVMNPLDNGYASSTFSEGNIKIVTNASAKAANTSTFGISSGKWYCEIKAVQIYNGYAQFGIKGKAPTSTTDGVGDGTDGYAYTASGGNKVNNGSATSYGTVWNNNDIIGIAVDLDNNKLYFSRNGTFQDSGDPTSGSTGTGAAFSLGTPSSGFYYIATSDGDTSGGSANTYEFNFGNSPFTISSGNADANGHGNFEYAVPSGYFALCTKNLAEFG